ncbi:MAG: radical SAM protein [Nitrospirota bacterium]
MLLINPPAAKPSEPPAGIAKLAGALAAHGVPFRVLDANLEGLFYLLGRPGHAVDTWSRRAAKGLPKNIASLREPATYRSLDRYKRAVRDINRVLAVSGGTSGAVPGLADYQHKHWSPLRSADLIAAAEHPEQNPYYPWFSKRLSEILSEGPMQFVGLSLNYLSQALCAFAMIGYIRKEFPGLKIVLGGGLVSSWMKRPGWKDPFTCLVDHLVAGPGEVPLLSLLGVEVRNGEHFAPDYGSLPRDKYLSPGFILPYSGSSGCYWNKCSFCPETAEDNPYHPVPAHIAVEDIRSLVAGTKPVLLHLLDNSVSPALMAALAAEPPGVPWYGFARIGQDLTDLAYCEALKRSGCAMLKLGLESGDQGVLDRLQKGIDLDMASRVLKTLKQAGIAAYVYLLFGTPEESEAEARKTLEFTTAHADAIGFLNLAVFNMPVCSQEVKGYDTEKFYDGDLSLYTGFTHPRGWDRDVVRRFLDKDFKRHPAVSAILKKDPPVFTSNHASFFTRP